MPNVLSSIGVGSAEVDLVLPETELHQGETIDARLEVEGGSDTQTVEATYATFETRYSTDDGSGRTSLSRQTITDEFTIEAGQDRTIPVELYVPPNAPVTVGGTEVWIETGLDIDWAVDPTDEDHVEIRAGPMVRTLLEEMDDLGFDFKTAEVEHAPSGATLGGSHAFVQEFEFRPGSSSHSNRVDEVELLTWRRDRKQWVQVEVERRTGNIGDKTADEERANRFAFGPSADAPRVEQLLREHIGKGV